MTNPFFIAFEVHMTPAAWKKLEELIRAHVPKSLGGSDGELQDLACEASARLSHFGPTSTEESLPDWLG